MMCQRCEELEEQVAYLKSEAQDCARAGELDALRAALRGGTSKVGGAGPARLLLALYRAQGRVMTKWQLMEQCPPVDSRFDDERDPKIIDVFVCRIRKTFGPESVGTVWGQGYRLTPLGIDLVGRTIGDIAQIPEAPTLEERSPAELRTLAALVAVVLAHKDGDGGKEAAAAYRRIADRLTGQPRVAA